MDTLQWASARGERREEGGEGRGECVDTLQWASKVVSREERGEGSAWLARLSAPARRFRRASIEEGNHEIHERDNNRTTNGHEWTRITSIHEAVSLILYFFRVFRAFRGYNILLF